MKCVFDLNFCVQVFCLNYTQELTLSVESFNLLTYITKRVHMQILTEILNKGQGKKCNLYNHNVINCVEISN